MARKATTGKSKGKRAKKINNSAVTSELSQVSLVAISPIIVETGWLQRVYIGRDDITDLDESWSELQVLLIGMVQRKYPTDYMTVLTNNTVLSDGINIRREMVYNAVYDEDSTYEVYKLPNNTYLEVKQTYQDKLNSLKKLFKSLKIDPGEVYLDIIPIKIAEANRNNTLGLTDDLINYSDVERVAETISLSDINESKIRLSDINISAISIFGYRQETESSMQALIMFMVWAYESYGEPVIKAAKKKSNDVVGITDTHNVEKYLDKYKVVRFGEMYLYMVADNYTIIKFIEYIADQVGIMACLIELEYKTFKLIK